MTAWVLLIDRGPREPSARRVDVWRKLKQLGALSRQDAICILPPTAWTREQFQWLAAEIAELGGEARFWEEQLRPPSQAATVIAQGGAQIAEVYQEILAALAAAEADLPAQTRRFQQTQAQEHFAAARRQEVRAALRAAQEGREP